MPSATTYRPVACWRVMVIRDLVLGGRSWRRALSTDELVLWPF
jgi:hypothetical protein